MSATWEYVSIGSLNVTLGMAAAGFSGSFTLEGRGGIACGSNFFSDVVFIGEGPAGSAGGGGLGTCGGNGGCITFVLRLGRTGGATPVSLVVETDLGFSSCFLFGLACGNSECVCLVPSCIMSMSSAFFEPVSRSGFVLDTPHGFVTTFSGLLASAWGLPSGFAFFSDLRVRWSGVLVSSSPVSVFSRPIILVLSH